MLILKAGVSVSLSNCKVMDFHSVVIYNKQQSLLQKATSYKNLAYKVVSTKHERNEKGFREKRFGSVVLIPSPRPIYFQ